MFKCHFSIFVHLSSSGVLPALKLIPTDLGKKWKAQEGLVTSHSQGTHRQTSYLWTISSFTDIFFILSKVSPSKNHILSKRALFQSRVWCRFMKGIGLPLIKPPTPPPILMREAWLVCDVPSVVSSALKSTYLQEAGPAWLKGALRQSPVGG